jgi:hypothetical protein
MVAKGTAETLVIENSRLKKARQNGFIAGGSLRLLINLLPDFVWLL